MRILIIDQCSKGKDFPEQAQSFSATEIDEHGLEELCKRQGVPTKKARDVYTGRQQRYITEAVDRLRSNGDEVDRYFISAGFGLVEENETLPPYDVTFADYTNGEIRERAERLSIESDLVELVDKQYDIIFFPLGSDYYASFSLERVLQETPNETWCVCFNHEAITENFDYIVSLPARTEEAKDHETIVVALKGRYLQYFAGHRSQGKEIGTAEDVFQFCTTEPTTQTGLDRFDE